MRLFSSHPLHKIANAAAHLPCEQLQLPLLYTALPNPAASAPELPKQPENFLYLSDSADAPLKLIHLKSAVQLTNQDDVLDDVVGGSQREGLAVVMLHSSGKPSVWSLEKQRAYLASEVVQCWQGRLQSMGRPVSSRCRYCN